MGILPLPGVGNPRQTGLPLAVEGHSSSLAQTKVVNAGSRGSDSGSKTPGSGSDIRGVTTTVLPLLYICSPQGAHWPEADPGRFCPESVPCDSTVQNDQSLVSETVSVSPSMAREPGPEGRLPPCTDKTESAQVSGSIVLGQAVLLQGSPPRLATAPWLFPMLIESALTILRREGLLILGYINNIVLWNPCSS